MGLLMERRMDRWKWDKTPPGWEAGQYYRGPRNRVAIWGHKSLHIVVLSGNKRSGHGEEAGGRSWGLVMSKWRMYKRCG